MGWQPDDTATHTAETVLTALSWHPPPLQVRVDPCLLTVAPSVETSYTALLRCAR